MSGMAERSRRSTWNGTSPFPNGGGVPLKPLDPLPSLPAFSSTSGTSLPLSPPYSAPSSPRSSMYHPSDQSWLEVFNRKSRENDVIREIDPGEGEKELERLKFATVRGTVIYSEEIEKRSSLKTSRKSARSKNATYSGKTAAVALKGTIYPLEKDPFEDFPEIHFKELPKCNLQLDKKQVKEYDQLVEEIKKGREKILDERNTTVRLQRKREEKLMKAFQDELKKKADEKLEEFRRKHLQLKKERKEAGDPMAKEESERILEEFEQKLNEENEKSQAEIEQRLIKQRLKAILPNFLALRAADLVYLTQLHSMEVIHLEELLAAERKEEEEREEKIAKEDFLLFEKELKGTMHDRKKANRPMAKAEISWEKEVFQQTQDEKFEEAFRTLAQEQHKKREELEKKQEKQVEDLLNFYDLTEKILLGFEKPRR